MTMVLLMMVMRQLIDECDDVDADNVDADNVNEVTMTIISESAEHNG